MKIGKKFTTFPVTPLEPSEQLTFSVFDSLLDTVIVVGEQEEIRYINPAFSTLTQIPTKRVKLRSPLVDYINFFPKIYKSELGIRTISKAIAYKEVKVVPKGGQIGQALISVQPFENDAAGETIWIFFIHDIGLEVILQQKYRHELDEKNRALEALKEAEESLQKYSKKIDSSS